MSEKFGLRILEGYGATEAAPVIAVNTPMHFQAGTVGRLLPAIEARLEEVPGIAEGGRLYIRGPNVMAGYLLAERSGRVAPARRWLARYRRHRHHRSGRLRHHSRPGQALCQDRRRDGLAPGGGSARGEAVARRAKHAVVSRPDPKKGEQLVLFTTQRDATAKALQEWGKAQGTTELMIPREIRVLEALPVLGTGKLDYVAMGELAKAGS